MQPALNADFTFRHRSARRKGSRSALRQILQCGRICAWLLGIVPLAACSTTPPPDCAAHSDITEYRQHLIQAAGKTAYGQGLLWRVDQADAPPSYLFGTAHSKGPRITHLAEPVAATFETARSLTIEVVRTPEFDRAVERSMKIQGSDVEPLVGPERLSQIRAAGARYGLQLQALRQLKPWALYVLFSLPPAEVQNSRLTLDFALQDRAEERGIPIYGLESVEEQLGVFDDLDPSFQIALLDMALEENWRIDCWWQTFEDVSLTPEIGFSGLLDEPLTATDAPLDRTQIDHFRRALVDDRNLRMVERMVPRLAEGGAFVAVGALHLSGERGILNLLAGSGYRISRVY
jgi:uncharacterized protein YbaP (TraB family)